MRTQTQTTTDFAPIDPLPTQSGTKTEFGKLSIHQAFSVTYVAFNKVEYRKIELMLKDGTWVNAVKSNVRPDDNSLYAHFNADAIVHI